MGRPRTAADYIEMPDGSKRVDTASQNERLTLTVDDLAALLQDVTELIRKYVATGVAERTALALWTAHSHAFEAAECTPYLHITSAEKQSGKTRLLETLALLAAKAWFTARVSPAVLVRRVARDTPSLLLDESDSVFKSKEEYSEVLRSILNAGYRRGAVASLCVKTGGDFELRDFAVYCPKALAGIGELPDTIADRSIRITMKRRAPGERVERFRLKIARTEAEPLRERLERWANIAIAKLVEAHPLLPDKLSDRACDVWEPLLAIADAAGGDWPIRARQAAVVLSGHDNDDSLSWSAQLLRDIASVLDGREGPIPSGELVAALVEREESPWGDLRGRPLDARKLARLLKAYGIKPRNVRVGDTVPKGYHREDFADAFARYVHTPEITATSATVASSQLQETIRYTEAEPEANVADAPQLQATFNVADVADKEGVQAEDSGQGICCVKGPGACELRMDAGKSFQCARTPETCQWRQNDANCNANLALRDGRITSENSGLIVR